MKPIEALQNMANHASKNGQQIIVIEQIPPDRRKRLPKYFADMGGKSTSPVLDYHGLNCFLMGFAKAK